jgi:hypothetical protein
VINAANTKTTPPVMLSTSGSICCELLVEKVADGWDASVVWVKPGVVRVEYASFESENTASEAWRVSDN